VNEQRVVQIYPNRTEAEVAAEVLRAEKVETALREIDKGSYELLTHYMDVARSRRALNLSCVVLKEDPGKSFVKKPCPNCGEITVAADRTFFLQSIVVSLFVAFQRNYEPLKKRWSCSTCMVCWVFAGNESKL
jgi:hypothetical protein